MYISTFLGNRFYPAEPHVDQIHIEDIAHGLAHSCRFNGQTTAFYSVAQHSLMVCDLVKAELKFAALMHDAAEAYLGDMVKPLKNLIPQFSEIEHRVTAIIAEAFRIPPHDYAAIKRADLVALATEKRDLMPYSTEPWAYLEDIEPMLEIIVPLSPAEAKQQFLSRFQHLAP